nr:DUF411 domain-containing protein [Alsobacter soli]
MRLIHALHGVLHTLLRPADALKRLLADRPAGKGLAVPGMPAGSPGMDAPGAKGDIYEAIVFGAESPIVFARCKGATAL